MSQNIIINADDFGKSHRVNMAIVECFARGYISSTTLMVNMPFADEAVELSKKYGFFDKVGLHLNLTEGVCLNENMKSKRLSDNGIFNGIFHHSPKTRLILSNQEIKEIYDEILLQIEKYVKYGCPNNHMDSHHHVHTDLAVYQAVKHSVKVMDIRSLRISRNINIEHSGYAIKIYKRLYNWKVKNLGLYTTDYFGSLDDFLAIGEKRNRLNNIELMCHPDYEDDKMKKLINMNAAANDFEDFFARVGKLKISPYPIL